MPSRRRVLAASVPLLASTAGCLSGGDTADVVLSNELDRAIEARLTVEPKSDGPRVLRQMVELAPTGEDGDSTTFSNPVQDDGRTHVVRVVVENGPRGSAAFTDFENGFGSTGDGGVRALVQRDEVRFLLR